MPDPVTIRANTPHSDGVVVGESPAAPVGFHGATPVAQAESTAFVARAAAAGANPTKAEYDGLVATVNALTAALIAKGLIALET